MSISVVVTTFDRPELLDQALLGITNQTQAPLQVIVIDDASTKDNDPVIAKYPNLNILYKKMVSHQGANAARNAGVALAHGDIVAFLDDDDIWFPTYIEEIRQAYQSGAQAVVSGYKRLERGTVHTRPDKTVNKESLVKGNQYCGTSGFSCLRAFLSTIKFDEQLLNGQDWDMYIRLFQHGVKICNIAKPLYYYRESSFLSISKMQLVMRPEDIDERFRSAYKHRSYIGERNFKRRISEQILMHLLQKQHKLKWIQKSIDKCGLTMTLSVLAQFAIRSVARKLKLQH